MLSNDPELYLRTVWLAHLVTRTLGRTQRRFLLMQDPTLLKMITNTSTMHQDMACINVSTAAKEVHRALLELDTETRALIREALQGTRQQLRLVAAIHECCAKSHLPNMILRLLPRALRQVPPPALQLTLVCSVPRTRADKEDKRYNKWECSSSKACSLFRCKWACSRLLL